MNVTSQVDIREFVAAMQRLSVISKRTFADVANDNMADLFLTASRYPPKANATDIRAVQNRPWWPAFVTKVIGHGFSLKSRVKAKTKAQRNVHWKDTPTGRINYGRDTMSVYRKAQIKKKALRGMFSGQFKGQSDADAKRVSSKIISRRVATVNAMRATIGWVATKFNPGKVRSFRHKNMKHSYVYPATPARAVAAAIISFTDKQPQWPNSPKSPHGRPSPTENVSWKERVGIAAINRAAPEVTRRLVYAADKKLARITASVSARTGGWMRF